MSRTYKDRPYKLRTVSHFHDTEFVEYEGIKYDWFTKDELGVTTRRYIVHLPTTKTKKRKEVDTENHWMTTPGWWIRLKHNKPQRRHTHMLITAISDVEDADIPNLKRKPHIYFW